VSEAVAASKPYQLGGAQGLTRGWGCCMGCQVSGDLIFYRSRLGNSLALHSKERGLAPVGLVAYVEVSGVLGCVGVCVGGGAGGITGVWVDVVVLVG